MIVIAIERIAIEMTAIEIIEMIAIETIDKLLDETVTVAVPVTATMIMTVNRTVTKIDQDIIESMDTDSMINMQTVQTVIDEDNAMNVLQGQFNIMPTGQSVADHLAALLILIRQHHVRDLDLGLLRNQAGNNSKQPSSRSKESHPVLVQVT